MAQTFKSRFDDLKGWLERLSPRERRMIGGLVAAVLVFVVLLVGYIIQNGLEEIETQNDDTRHALRDLEKYKDAYMVQRQRIAALEVRMSRTPLELNRFVETAASAVGVSIAESGEIPAVVGDRYTQRGVEIKLRKVNIEQLGKLLKELENSPHIVQISSLSVNTRWNQHQDLDVEMTVSTYERRTKDQKPDGEAKGSRTRDRT
jgi:type II secretory pathway component PulM